MYLHKNYLFISHSLRTFDSFYINIILKWCDIFKTYYGFLRFQTIHPAVMQNKDSKGGWFKIPKQPKYIKPANFEEHSATLNQLEWKIGNSWSTTGLEPDIHSSLSVLHCSFTQTCKEYSFPIHKLWMYDIIQTKLLRLLQKLWKKNLVNTVLLARLNMLKTRHFST